MIYGLSVQKIGDSLEFRCSECMRSKAQHLPLVWKFDNYLKIYCEAHPDNYGQWRSETEMEQDKIALAKRIGLI